MRRLRAAHQARWAVGKQEPMLSSTCQSRTGIEQRAIAVRDLVIAGWTGRDEAAIRHHIKELAAIGVPRPSSTPVFYRVSAANLTQDSRLVVLGGDTSGEVEPVIVAAEDGLWLGLGSDHT